MEATYARPERWVTLNDHLHPRQETKIKNVWKDGCTWYGRDMVRRFGKPPANVRVEGQIIFGTKYPNHRRDPSNWSKVEKWIWDGLVLGGLLADDDSKHLIQLTTKFSDAIHPTHFTIQLTWQEP